MLVGGGVAVSIVTAAFVIAFAFWSAARVKSAAEIEALLLRETFSVEVTASRRDGGMALAELQDDFLHQSDQAAEQLSQIGDDLTAVAQERDAAS